MVIFVAATAVKAVMVIPAEEMVVRTVPSGSRSGGPGRKKSNSKVVGAEVVISLAQVQNQDRKALSYWTHSLSPWLLFSNFKTV